jgi:hypothetical protein
MQMLAAGGDPLTTAPEEEEQTLYATSGTSQEHTSGGGILVPARNSAKSLLHVRTMPYDLTVMLQFFDSSADQTYRAISQSHFAPSWINAGVLATLGNFKAKLEETVVGLSEQASDEFWSGADVTLEYAALRAIDFWQRLSQNGIIGCARTPGDEREALYIDFVLAASSPNHHPECPSRLGLPSPKALYSTEPAVSIVSGRCRRCWWGGGLVERQRPYGCFALISCECPVCGCPAAGAGLVDLIPTIVDPLVSLTRALLCEIFRRYYEDILRLVISAIAVLLSRLKRSPFRSAIATSQRSFFACHGAHPPRIQRSRAPGLLSGMAFQPNVAV